MQNPDPSQRTHSLTDVKRALLEKRLRGGAAGAQRLDTITPRARRDYLPLSFSQQRLWFLEHLEPGLGFNHIHAAIRAEGELDTDALRRSLTEIVRRHESLRTNFRMVDGSPVQVVAPPREFPLPQTDLRHLRGREQEDEVERRDYEEAHLPFDLEHDPLFRGQLLVLGPTRHVLLLTMHHVISDGWSIGVMIRELGVLYEAFRAGRPSPLPELELQYTDFAAWQREYLSGAVLERQLDYWRKQLGGVATLELQTDHPRPPVQSFRGRSHWFTVPRALTSGLHALAQREGATLFMVGLAAFDVLLSRYSGQDDVVVGTPIANRNRIEIEPLVGFFVNTLVMRTDLSGDPTFRELVRRVRETALGAYGHQDLPFEKLVDEVQPERDLSRNPLFQVMFALQNAPGKELVLTGLRLTWEPPASGTSKFDLMLWMQEQEGELTAVLEYNTDLFDAATIRRMERHYLRVLESVVADPEVRVSEVPLLDSPERRAVLRDPNATAAPYPATTIHALVEAQARRTPHAPAVTFERETLTFAELEDRAGRLAAFLRGRGVGPEVRVGVCMERSPELVVSLLAVLKAGGAYVPLDPSYPRDRLAYVAEDAAVPLVLTQERLAGVLPPGGAEVLHVDAGWARIAAEAPFAAGEGDPDALAYVIYTSGSTGRPKGAMNAHRGVANRLLWMQEAYGLDASDAVLQKTPFSFDVSVWEFFWPLATGARLVLARPDGHRDPAYLSGVIAREGITTLHFVPSMLHAFLDAADLERCGGLRRVVCSGEALPRELQDRFHARLPEVELHNLYGPTEAAVDVTHWRCEPGSARHSVPIGRPVANTRIYVLDARMSPVPVGVPGELYIGGVQVGRGYLGRPDLTAERFVPDPFAGEGGARLYRTGDRVRRLAGGEIEYLGRLDEQVKIRGFRIEPGEIEHALVRQPGVRECAVVVREDAPGQRRLVAYMVPDGDGAVSVPGVRSALRDALPEYMVPSAFVTLDALPLTPSGKLDRRALPAPEQGPAAAVEASPDPRTPLEETLAGIWCGVLRRDRVGVNDNFFELGGDSILSIQVISRAAQAGIRLTPKQMFLYQTVAELAAVADTAAAIQAEQGEVVGPVPLTPVQRWFFELEAPTPGHWNQAVLLEVREPLDAAVLEGALAAVAAHHDALRLRFTRAGAEWRQESIPAGSSIPCERVDLSGASDEALRAAVEEAGARAQAGLDLAAGPLARAVYFGRGAGAPGRLLVVVHHLAVDGVSWGVLLEDLERACRQLSRGEPVRLLAKTTSFRQWAERLAAHAHDPELRAEAALWTAAAGAPAAPLPVDLPGGRNLEADAVAVVASLGEEDTHALVHDVPSVYRTQINDALLAALARTLAGWTGGEAVRVELEGHGREPLFEEVDLSRTVGWFTSVFPVRLEVEPGAGAGETLRSVKEQLRAIPGKGIGYGILRYLADEETAAPLRALPTPEVSFNYLGRLDLVQGEGIFRPVGGSMGPAHAPDAPRRYLLEINAGIEDGRLQVSWSYGERVHLRSTVERLAERYLEELRAIVEHCRAPEAGGYTPSDFPEAGLAQEELDDLIAEFIALNG